jgi:predicted Fe-Mo cluster-binding NifX family protein
MEIAITSSGSDLQSAVDSRFGRSKNFIIYNTEDDSIEVIDNVQNLNAMQGAGIQSAKTVIESGAKAVITGNVGPKAFNVLDGNGVEMYINATGSVENAIKEFKDEALEKISDANVESHWV